VTAARLRLLLATVLALTCVAGLWATSAGAEEGEGEGGAAWRLEQPLPPSPPVGVPGSSTPIGLGRVGDIEFAKANRGVLITPGNGSTIPAGVWSYNGQRWQELATVCGAVEGHIAWAGSEEFWTISDGRPGQALNPATGEPAPLTDRTLCHFAHGKVAGSYASPAFQVSSYQAMHALGCITENDCWFAGDQLPAPSDNEAFHLHWNGSSLSAEPNPHGHSVQDMRAFEGRLHESVRLLAGDRDAETEVPFAFALHTINPEGVSPAFESVLGVPLYDANETPEALDALHLGADEEALWAAAGPANELPAPPQAPLTVVRYAGGQWTQVLGPEAVSSGASAIEDDVVHSIAPEPGTNTAWMALDSKGDAQQPSPTESALIARVSTDGTVETQTLPSAAEVAEGIGPKGAAQQISCPALNDCWMTTTQGWLFHLAPEGERQLPIDSPAPFTPLITFRPPDEGLPQLPPDAPPADDSGELPPSASKSSLVAVPEASEAKVREALVSNIHSRLVHGTTTLELRFHLTVKARVRLVAKRKKQVVASTAMHTFAAGNRKLLLRLNTRRWPTKLDLQTHALSALPLVSTRLPGNNTVGTDVAALPGAPALGDSTSLAAPFRGTLP
jgi:hypothetical protein